MFFILVKAVKQHDRACCTDPAHWYFSKANGAALIQALGCNPRTLTNRVRHRFADILFTVYLYCMYLTL